MNDRIQSHVRHILTALIAGLVLLLKHSFVSQSALIGVMGDTLAQAVDPVTLILTGYLVSVLLKATGKWPWLSYFIGTAGSGGSASAVLLMCCVTCLAMAAGFTSCSTTSITRTDAKGYRVVTETKAFDTGVAKLIAQGLTIFGAKQPKTPAAATGAGAATAVITATK